MTEIAGWHLLLVAGIPATGKSTLCRFLAREYGFATYDLECFPRGWPMPGLKAIWARSRADFVKALRDHHSRVALDWGFPPRCIQWVEELQAAGARLVWLTGDVAHARIIYVQRGGLDERDFDNQVRDIASARYPELLHAKVVAALTPEGTLRNLDDLVGEIFAEENRL
jgi:hypothetical protein